MVAPQRGKEPRLASGAYSRADTQGRPKKASRSLRRPLAQTQARPRQGLQLELVCLLFSFSRYPRILLLH